ncbi:ion channel [Bifidobacterium subtile]|nr:potassium channel family protein [Bifidobacterium subtile]QOL36204.1 potassium channel family protein [Bifidobacterium subtile]
MKLTKWESLTEWPLTVLSVLFLGVYAWQILAQPRGSWNVTANGAMNALWLIFALDYVIALVLAENRKEYFKHHLFDLAVVLLPIIRPLRALRVLTALNALHRTTGMALRGKIIIYVTASAVLLVLVGSLAVLEAERYAPGATIRTFPEALWWTFVTIATVGFGDYTPMTATGRLIAFVLMIAEVREEMHSSANGGKMVDGMGGDGAVDSDGGMVVNDGSGGIGGSGVADKVAGGSGNVDDADNNVDTAVTSGSIANNA